MYIVWAVGYRSLYFHFPAIQFQPPFSHRSAPITAPLQPTFSIILTPIAAYTAAQISSSLTPIQHPPSLDIPTLKDIDSLSLSDISSYPLSFDFKSEVFMAK